MSYAISKERERRMLEMLAEHRLTFKQSYVVAMRTLQNFQQSRGKDEVAEKLRRLVLEVILPALIETVSTDKNIVVSIERNLSRFPAKLRFGAYDTMLDALGGSYGEALEYFLNAIESKTSQSDIKKALSKWKPEQSKSSTYENYGDKERGDRINFLLGRNIWLSSLDKLSIVVDSFKEGHGPKDVVKAKAFFYFQTTVYILKIFSILETSPTYLSESLERMKMGTSDDLVEYKPLSHKTKGDAERIMLELDTNGDGVISQMEAIKACREKKREAGELGLPLGHIRQEDDMRIAFHHVFMEIDENGNKALELSELLKRLQPKKVRK